MKASRLIFTLLLASSVAVVQLAGQQTKADQKPIGEVKAKAEAGDAESQVELGLRYDNGIGVAKDAHARIAREYAFQTMPGIFSAVGHDHHAGVLGKTDANPATIVDGYPRCASRGVYEGVE